MFSVTLGLMKVRVSVRVRVRVRIEVRVRVRVKVMFSAMMWSMKAHSPYGLSS